MVSLVRSEDRKPSRRVFPLLQNLDLDSVTFAQIQGVGDPITIEDMNEQEMYDLVLVNLARLVCSGEWTGLLSAGGGSGDVTGPGSSTDNAIARFDGTGGKTLQNSGLTIDDSGNLTIGDGTGNAYFSNRGSHDLIIWTNDGTNTGKIRVRDGVNADISIDPNGTGKTIIGSPQFESSDPPASSSATGTAGQLAYDANYLYICTATDTWERVAVAAW